MPRPLKRKLALLLLIWLAACASSPPAVEQAEEGRGGEPVMVYVAGHGWHTGWIVPAVDMQARIPALGERFGDASFLEFGWGDKAFYQADEITAGAALKAVLWPTESVMHVVAVPLDVEGYFAQSELHRLCLPPDRYAALLDFIAGSFRRSDTGGVFPGRAGLYGDSSFYDAVGTYSLFNTCNTWTAKGLQSAGFDIGTAFKATAASVMKFLRRLDRPFDAGCAREAATAFPRSPV